MAAGRLGLLSSRHALVLGGSVLRARHPQLHDQVVSGARSQAPEVEISVPQAPPITGAALLALDALGLEAGAEERLRAAVPHLARAAVPEPVSAW